MKAKKATEREERRVARKQRRADRAAGVLDGPERDSASVGAADRDEVDDAQADAPQAEPNA
ncbi:MAG TPA: hypothetical protein VHL78_09340 [Actinomycetota bacterium]|nr:hypothetical protein [Actinomycetota bacterium]